MPLCPSEDMLRQCLSYSVADRLLIPLAIVRGSSLFIVVRLTLCECRRQTISFLLFCVIYKGEIPIPSSAAFELKGCLTIYLPVYSPAYCRLSRR